MDQIEFLDKVTDDIMTALRENGVPDLDEEDRAVIWNVLSQAVNPLFAPSPLKIVPWAHEE